MDNIIMENNQLKQVPATASTAIGDEDDHISPAETTTKRESTTDIDVSRFLDLSDQRPFLGNSFTFSVFISKINFPSISLRENSFL